MKAPTTQAATTRDQEDRRHHLDHLHGIINRQAAASATAKGWLLTLTTGLLGVALTLDRWPLAVLAVAPVLLFAYLDAHYLTSERRYRQLYSAVARGEDHLPAYCVDPSAVHPPGTRPASSGSEQRKVWASWSILPFYAVLLLIIGGAAITTAL